MFLMRLIQNLMKTSVIEFSSRVLNCRLYSCVLIKKWLYKRQLLKIFESVITGEPRLVLIPFDAPKTRPNNISSTFFKSISSTFSTF